MKSHLIFKDFDMERMFNAPSAMKFIDDDTLCRKITDLNIGAMYDIDNEIFCNYTKSVNPAGQTVLDDFSFALLSKSRLGSYSDDRSTAVHSAFSPSCLSLREIENSLHDDSFDLKVDNNVIFKDLKDMLTQNLFESLREYVNEIYHHDTKQFSANIETGIITISHDYFRTRALIILRKCIVNSKEINMIQIYLALREKYDVIEHPSIPSIGSILHLNGYCKPCVFANKKSNSCKSDFRCNFCHYHHKLVRRKSSKNNALIRSPSQLDSLDRFIQFSSKDDILISIASSNEDHRTICVTNS